MGESEESMPVAYSGPLARIGFNVSYLADFLSRTEEKTIRLLFNNADSATEWQPVTAAAVPDFRYIVMPMRVS